MNGVLLAPVPGHQFIELLDGMAGDTGEDVGQPGLGIDVVELGGDDEAVHEGGTVAATIGAGEQPGFPAKGDATQGSFGGIVAEADAAVVEESGEGVPTLEHVIDGAGDVGVARQLTPFLAHPCFERGDQRRGLFVANGKPPIGRQTVDGALDLEQGVDPPDCFEGDRRDNSRGSVLGLASGIGLNIGEDEELAPRMAPARRLQDGTRASLIGIQLAVAAIGIGLQDAGPGSEMLPWMFPRAVARVEEQRRRRRPAAERAVVADVGPTSCRDGLALGQHGHRRVVAV